MSPRIGPSAREALGTSSALGKFVAGQHQHAEQFSLVVEGLYEGERVFVQHRFEVEDHTMAQVGVIGYRFKLYYPNRTDTKETPKIVVTDVGARIQITKPVSIKFSDANNMLKMDFYTHAINVKFVETFSHDEDVKSDDERFQVRPSASASALPLTVRTGHCLTQTCSHRSPFPRQRPKHPRRRGSTPTRAPACMAASATTSWRTCAIYQPDCSSGVQWFSGLVVQ